MCTPRADLDPTTEKSVAQAARVSGSHFYAESSTGHASVTMDTMDKATQYKSTIEDASQDGTTSDRQKYAPSSPT